MDNSISKITNDIKSLENKIIELDNQKMSRQKLQCTATYKQNLREQRRLEDEKHKLELHKEIVSNPDRTINEWKVIFENNAKKQVEKNIKDKNKKRISQKTYEKRERGIVAEYKQKLAELDMLNKEIEKFGINRHLLIEELDKRINNNKTIIASKQEERKQMRQQNELKNKEIDKQKEKCLSKLSNLEFFAGKKKMEVKKEDLSIDEKNADIRIEINRGVGDTGDLNFKTNNEKKPTSKSKKDLLDLNFKPNNNKLKDNKELDDISFGNKTHTKKIEIGFQDNNINQAIQSIKVFNNNKNRRVLAVNEGFYILKYNLEDLKQYTNTIFDFSGANKLSMRERKYYRKLAREARKNGLNVAGYEENETFLNKFISKVFKRKVQVNIEGMTNNDIASTFRERIVISSSNNINIEDKKQNYNNPSRKVAITR